MRIAQIAPLAEAVPPFLYGGTERVVSWLTEELVRCGHEVTLFAAEGSITKSELVAEWGGGLRLKGINDHVPINLLMLEEVKRRESEFDIIHCHIDQLQYPLFANFSHKLVTTLHGRLDVPAYWAMYETYPHMPLISISTKQREPIHSKLNWLATVYHGMPESICPFNAAGGDYLVFLGRISREKRPDRAIEIAKRCGIKLKIAAKVDKADLDYFNEIIEPLLDHPLIEFLGEINDTQKAQLLGNALALLFPIDWIEPFGLVMIEAMSAGTPIIAWRNGSVPEIIQDGVNGFIVDSIEEAVNAVKAVTTIDRIRVRHTFETRFTDKVMARNYILAYQRLIDQRPISDIDHPAGKYISIPIEA